MAVVEVKLSEFGRVIQKYSSERLEDLRKATIKGVIRSLPDIVASSPVDLGQYAASWDFTETEKSVILGNFAPHAPIIESGARPGFTPPIGPLLAWAKRILQSSSQPPNYDSEVWRLAKGTQNKIFKEGITPKKVLEGNIPGIIKNVLIEMKKLSV